jgi:hypothetical protein
MSFPLSDRLQRLREMFEVQLGRALTGEELKLLELTGPTDDPEEPLTVLPNAMG